MILPSNRAEAWRFSVLRLPSSESRVAANRGVNPLATGIPDKKNPFHHPLEDSLEDTEITEASRGREKAEGEGRRQGAGIMNYEG